MLCIGIQDRLPLSLATCRCRRPPPQKCARPADVLVRRVRGVLEEVKNRGFAPRGANQRSRFFPLLPTLPPSHPRELRAVRVRAAER